jgi:hypothetical protein
MQYAIPIVFIAIALITLGMISFVRHESKLVARPSLTAATRTLRRSNRLVVASAAGECECGGILGPTGQTSRRYGELLACSDCGKTFTADGRRIILRRRPEVVTKRIRPVIRRRIIRTANPAAGAGTVTDTLTDTATADPEEAPDQPVA